MYLHKYALVSFVWWITYIVVYRHVCDRQQVWGKAEVCTYVTSIVLEVHKPFMQHIIVQGSEQIMHEWSIYVYQSEAYIIKHKFRYSA